MKTKKLRDMTSEELQQVVQESVEEIASIKAKRGLGESDNPMKVRELKKTLARAKTIIREWELKKDD